MSVRDEQTENLEEEVVVNEEETTELVELEREAKKAKVVEIAKKVLKVAGIAAVGIVGFVIGSAVGSKSEDDTSDIIDVENEQEITDAE